MYDLELGLIHGDGNGGAGSRGVRVTAAEAPMQNIVYRDARTLAKLKRRGKGGKGKWFRGNGNGGNGNGNGGNGNGNAGYRLPSEREQRRKASNSGNGHAHGKGSGFGRGRHLLRDSAGAVASAGAGAGDGGSGSDASDRERGGDHGGAGQRPPPEVGSPAGIATCMFASERQMLRPHEWVESVMAVESELRVKSVVQKRQVRKDLYLKFYYRAPYKY